MQHGFDLQREITQPTTPENVHFLRDNNGPYVKIYYSDNNKEYELFDRNQQENLVFMNNMDMFNYVPNTQNNQMPFQPMMMNQAPKHPTSSHNNNNNNNNSNSVIHHLVTSNLGPGKFEFGTFGGHNNNSPTTNATNSTYSTAPSSTATPLNITIPHLDSSSYNNNNNGNSNIENGASTADSSPIANMTSMQSPTMSTSAQDASSPNNSNSINNNNASNKKQRIVAEVKPMRMSYSDVVSKNAVPTTSSTSIGQTNSASSSPNTTMPITINNNNKGNKVKYTPSNSFEKKQQENVDKNRKSPTNPTIITNNATNTEVKKSPPVMVKAEKPTIATAAQNQSQNGKKKKQQTKDSVNVKSAKNDATVKNQERYATDSDYDNNDEDENSSMIDSDNDEDTLSSDYYDIRKNIYQGEHHKVEKIRTSAYKKNSKQAQSSTTLTSTSKKVDRGQKRMSGKATTNRKQKHEFLQKLFASCVEYLYIFVKWLWMLIYDVSYLSFGIVLDRLNWTYQCGLYGVSFIRRELSSNPGKVLIVRIKNVWKRFDNKFDKKSKWAFWRWLFKKQSSSDNAKDSYKDGKLPKTAEEAMKSLLNCKEKDAYR